MNKFGISSQSRLMNLHPDLRMLCYDVLAHFDISILCTDRNKSSQAYAIENGYSKAEWLESPHNYMPSFAVDVGLWSPEIHGIDYTDKEAFRRVTDCFKLHASHRGIKIECGIDWEDAWDMPHIQLKNWRELI